MSSSIVSIVALLVGCGVAWIIQSSAILTRLMDSLNASLWIHAIGAIFASLLLGVAYLFPRLRSYLIHRPQNSPHQRAPWWSYLGGILGGTLVAISAVTTTSAIGLSGTISCVLLGQMSFGSCADHYGWFGLKKRRFTRIRAFQLILVLGGSWILIFYA